LIHGHLFLFKLVIPEPYPRCKQWSAPGSFCAFVLPIVVALHYSLSGIGCALFGEMRRLACLAACKACSDVREQEGEQEDPRDDDDPLRLWCSCQQPHGGNFMIMCDIQGENCYEWSVCSNLS